jgi:DNA mismatch repair protein MutS2
METTPHLHAARALELHAILDRVCEYCYSEIGVRMIRELPFHSEPGPLIAELSRVTEMRDLIAYDDAFPFRRFSDITPILRRCATGGALLSGQDLLAVSDLLALSRHVRRYFEERREKYPLLSAESLLLKPIESLEKEIQSIVEPTGEISDGASAALGRIRREILHRKELIRRRLEAILRSMVKSGFAQEEQLALRDGRLVIPMKEAAGNRLKGVVIDQSASGATVFIEPLDALEMNNELRRLHIQELQEIERILRQITEKVAGHSDTIRGNLSVLAGLDSVHARGRHSLSVQGNACRISETQSMSLKNARHPILLSRLDRTQVVPLDLELGGGRKTVVVTGPNAGGKTVALKTVGLLAMMHHHGLHVPADEGTCLPMLSAVFADIGDSQSIENDLSTFSSHIRNIKRILDAADSRSLVLLDEIGSSTDPAEGGALAVGILRALTLRGCLCMATTHIGMLKVFAHDEPGVENGSMIFDQSTLKPTYRFQMGLPGSSYAFEIAGKLGFPADLVEEAKAAMGPDRGRLDRILFDLEDRLLKAEALHREALAREVEYAGLVRSYEAKIRDLDLEAGERTRRLIAEAESALAEANLLKERVVREIRESAAGTETVKSVHRQIEAQRAALKSLTPATAKPGPSRSGRVPPPASGRVAWPGHPGSGSILSRPDKDGKVLVEWNEVKLRVPQAELVPVTVPDAANKNRGFVQFEIERLSNNEVDLRGLTADEAVDALERFLHDAVAAGFSNARIIHGKGTGVLRREVAKMLSGHRLIKNARPGAWNEGDTGVTIVEFK